MGEDMGICIIGHFGGKEMFSDGQTVKTLAVYNAFQNQGIEPDIVDTYFIHKKNIVCFLYSFIRSILLDKKYIVLLSKNGRRVLFPFLFFLSRYMKKEIYHYAIGGRLADEVEGGKYPVSRLNTFCANWVESETLVKRLHNLGVTNAKYVPNFKNISAVPKQELVTEFHEPYRFCTFSRVVKVKGISDAVYAIRSVNDDLGRIAVKLDIYGPVDDDYRDEFKTLVTGNEAVQYCGVIPANKSTTVLKDYYMLLFPSYFIGEGMPGTIIDALSAGVPVVARRWAYCDEMITNGVNGYVYDFDRPELLREKILYAIAHVQQTVEMRKNCLQSVRKYNADEIIGKIRKDMQI